MHNPPKPINPSFKGFSSLGRRAAATVLIAPAMLLTACQTTYSVAIENLSRRSVNVEVIQRVTLDADRSLGRTTVPAGEGKALGPYEAGSFDDVGLRVSVTGSGPGSPFLLNLKPGDNTVAIEDAGVESWEPVTAYLVDE